MPICALEIFWIYYTYDMAKTLVNTGGITKVLEVLILRNKNIPQELRWRCRVRDGWVIVK